MSKFQVLEGIIEHLFHVLSTKLLRIYPRSVGIQYEVMFNTKIVPQNVTDLQNVGLSLEGSETSDLRGNRILAIPKSK